MKQDASPLSPSALPLSTLMPGLLASASPAPQALQLALLRLYVDNHRLDRVLVPLMSLTAGLLLALWVPWQAALAWVGASVTLTFTCLRLYDRCQREVTATNVEQWVHRIGLAHGALIFNWSALGLWAWVPGDFANHLSIAVILLGVIAANTAMSSPHLRLFALDMLAPILILLVRPLIEGQSLYYMITGMAVCFVLLMVHVGIQIHHNLARMVKLQAENQQLIRQLENMATTDALTGVYNRRYFLLAAEQELQRCRRYQHPVSLLMIDVDHFKSINDNGGHAAGDQVLRRLAAVLVGELRRSDMIGRLGGEEFALLLPETNLAMASLIAERIRSRVAAARFGQQGQELQITLSLGLAEAGGEITSLQALMERADKRMYRAKQLGRNRVVSRNDSEAAANDLTQRQPERNGVV